MTQINSINSKNRYEIKIHGPMEQSWRDWFGDAKARVEILADDRQATTFTDVVMDQAGLVGLIRRLHGLGVVLISIIRLDAPFTNEDPAKEESPFPG